MKKSERPSATEYCRLLDDLRSVLVGARELSLRYNRLDHWTRLRKSFWMKYINSDQGIRTFILKLEYLIRGLVEEAEHHHPGVFKEDYGKFIKDIMKVVNE
jgi:hypothetical protein